MRLRRANLLRLFRLYRHGDRDRRAARLPAAVRTSRRPISPPASSTSGADGTSACHRGCATISTFRSAAIATGNTNRNLMVTMLLGGLWHGASWTLVAWGALHGVGLVVNRAWRSMRRVDAELERYSLIGNLATFAFVWFASIFFRAPDFPTASLVISRLIELEPPVQMSWPYAMAALASLTVSSRAFLFCQFAASRTTSRRGGICLWLRVRGGSYASFCECRRATLHLLPVLGRLCRCSRLFKHRRHNLWHPRRIALTLIVLKLLGCSWGRCNALCKVIEFFQPFLLLPALSVFVPLYSFLVAFKTGPEIGSIEMFVQIRRARTWGRMARSAGHSGAPYKPATDRGSRL